LIWLLNSSGKYEYSLGTSWYHEHRLATHVVFLCSQGKIWWQCTLSQTWQESPIKMGVSIVMGVPLNHLF
jgi:hypothetical protein